MKRSIDMGVAAVVVTVGLAAADPALAQEEATTTLAPVLVTGSNIKRVNAEGALPVQVLSRKDIERSGATTALELLAKMSASGGNAYTEALGGDGVAPGFSGVSLRGLGEASTLVLLNGRRLANFAFSGTGADLNSIPVGAIDRIEVLTDGASAIYGTDAIGGVINFILRTSYTGLELQAGGGVTQHGGAANRKFSIAGGLGTLGADGYNVLASLDYAKTDALAAKQRSFSRTGYRPEIGLNNVNTLASYPANIAILDADGNLAGWTNPKATSGCPAPTIKNGTSCDYDDPSTINILPESDKMNFVGKVSLAAGKDHELFGEVVLSQNRVYNVSAPGNATLKYLITSGTPPLIEAGNPNFPASQAGSPFVLLGINTAPAGPSITRTTTRSSHVVLGGRGNAAGWDYDAAVVLNQSRAKDRGISGFVSVSKFDEALQSGVINPFGPQSAAGEKFYQDAQIRGDFRKARGTTNSVELRASRDLFDLPAGPLGFALGVELRKETFTDQFDKSKTDDAIGFGVSPSRQGTRKVKAAYTEFAVPLAKGLDAQLAVRADNYDDFGNTVNPKVGLKWKLGSTTLLRTSAGTGFRAPALPELYTPNFATATFQSPHDDPLRCPTTGLATDCNTSFTATVGGSPSLKAEESKQFSIGFVTEPAAGMSLSLDYWRIRKDNAIELVLDNAIFANYAQFESQITRGPVDPAFPKLPGPITNVAMGYLNFGSIKTAGIDVDARYRITTSDSGQFDVGIRGTLVTTAERDRGGQKSVLLGRGDSGPAIQRWRHTLNVGWERAPFGATFSNSFTAGYVDEFPGADGKERRVASYQTSDVQGRYAVNSALSLTVGIKNLFDRDPPASNQTDLLQAGYDPRFTDPRGRQYYAVVRYVVR